MRLIDMSAELIKETNPLIKIEMAGRTCYKSNSAFTTETAIKFAGNLIKRQHYSVFEHAYITFLVVDPDLVREVKELENKFLFISYNTNGYRTLISGNVRAINESGCVPLITALYAYCPQLVFNKAFVDEKQAGRCYVITDTSYLKLSPAEMDGHLAYTFRFVCDRGVSHEIVRHRMASYSQESSRYCRYSADKFGNEITYVKPSDYDKWDSETRELFETELYNIERVYMTMLDRGYSPEKARAILPNALKTEIIMTATLKEWKHFFNLRYFGTTGAPHPDMKHLAGLAYDALSAEGVLSHD